MTTFPFVEKLRADAAAEVARLEAEVERARQIERAFWIDPTNEKTRALAEVSGKPLPPLSSRFDPSHLGPK